MAMNLRRLQRSARSQFRTFLSLLLLQLMVRPRPSSSIIKQMTSTISGNEQYWRSAADKLRAWRLARTGQGPQETAAVRKEPSSRYLRSVADKIRVQRLARTGKKSKETAAVRRKVVKKRWIVTRKGLHFHRRGENGWLRFLPSLTVPPCFQGAHTRRSIG